MRNSVLFLLFAVVFALPSTQAQLFRSKKMNKGSITYTLNVEESKDPNVAMVNNSTLKLVFLKGDLRATGAVMGGLIMGDLIMNSGDSKGLALIQMMGEKTAMKIPSEDVKKAQKEMTNLDEITTQFKEVKGGEKEIAGYKCRKVFANNPKDPSTKVAIYLTDKIDVSAVSFMGEVSEKLGGFPLGVEVDSPDGKFSMLATEIDKSTPVSSNFDLVIPEGYTEKTSEELQQTSPAIGG